MSEPRVTVAIPVGPLPYHQNYLDACLESVIEQTELPGEILIIDDMAGLPPTFDGEHEGPIRVWRAPWRLGVAAAFNMGVALARNELVFMLGADDKLMPACLERSIKAYNRNRGQDALYWVGVRYSDGREDQFEPCNTAMVTKGLWRITGGFPPETGSGAPDAALISIMLGNGMAKLLHCVDGDEPLAWYRVHGNTDTAGRGPWQGVILSTRDLLTRTWTRPQWGRFS